MRHRVFIAINLPEDIKNNLSRYQEKWPELPAGWTKKDNLHITLFFIGYVSDEELPEICQITKEVALRHPAFSIKLNKICYGPPDKMPPRMIWIEGEKSEELAELHKDLESSLFASSFKELSGPGARLYAPHITFGRIRQWDFRRIEPEERPEVEENISFSFEASSIEVMESRLKRGGPEYTILELCPLTPLEVLQ